MELRFWCDPHGCTSVGGPSVVLSISRSGLWGRSRFWVHSLNCIRRALRNFHLGQAPGPWSSQGLSGGKTQWDPPPPHLPTCISVRITACRPAPSTAACPPPGEGIAHTPAHVARRATFSCALPGLDIAPWSAPSAEATRATSWLLLLLLLALLLLLLLLVLLLALSLLPPLPTPPFFTALPLAPPHSRSTAAAAAAAAGAGPPRGGSDARGWATCHATSYSTSPPWAAEGGAAAGPAARADAPVAPPPLPTKPAAAGGGVGRSRRDSRPRTSTRGPHTPAWEGRNTCGETGRRGRGLRGWK